MNNKENNNITTIKVSMGTRDRLIEIGKKNETYDELINNLISFWVKNKK
mgnify:CR=1 FL=1